MQEVAHPNISIEYHEETIRCLERIIKMSKEEIDRLKKVIRHKKKIGYVPNKLPKMGYHKIKCGDCGEVGIEVGGFSTHCVHCGASVDPFTGEPYEQ